jgi:hypothetical protein
MRIGRAVLGGLGGAMTMSVLAAGLRAVGVPFHLELVLGSLVGPAPGTAAFALGLAIHLGVGTLFGLAYGYLFERVWAHGGALTGVLIGVIHAAFFGVFIGITPQFHPHIPERLLDPGPYFSNTGIVGTIAFFLIHLLYGAIVGGVYGHVPAEREWSPLAFARIDRATRAR